MPRGWCAEATETATEITTETTAQPETRTTQTSPTPPEQPLSSTIAPADRAPSKMVTMQDYFASEPTPPPAIQTVKSPTRPVPKVAVTAPDCSAMNWSALQQTVTECQLCSLHQSRTQTVFGAGDIQADWMIIGEAPGAEEDRQGQPFVGRAGKLLNNMLAAAGLPRSAVYICNVLKCRPPNNRDPKPDEAALCRGYLERQIALVNPVLIIVVGRIAAHNLLHTTTPLGRLRGQVHQLPDADTPVIVTYHPAYLLRQPAEKRKAWQDLQLARQVMAAR
ncbi:MAG: uracil-DNA glycosylase [Thiothrix nivea]|nr:MAG: uracil-DNA glycosylase [Thiothrix nivea]